MKRWEYCAIALVGRTSEGGLYTHYPELVTFGIDGPESEDFGGGGTQEQLRTSKAIAQLGLDGWELVGAAPTHEKEPTTYSTLYFKRPIED